MAQQSKTSNANPTTHNNNNNNNNNYCYYNDDDDDDSTTTRSQRRQRQQQHQQEDVKAAMFHDFLGMKAVSAAVLAPKTADASTAASTSVGASSGGGGRGPLSATSDLVSVEKQVASQLEGIPFYTPTRSDISGPDISDRLTGAKRSNSDSAFTGSTREGILQMNRAFPDGLHLMKMLKHGGGVEQSRRSNDDENVRSMQPMGPACTSHVLQQSTGSRLDHNVSKWGRSISMGSVQCHARGFQLVPSAHQVPANRFRDTSAGPSIISQLVADEGSRTGIKGPGISAISGGGGISEKIPSRLLPRDSKLNSGTHVPEPESTSSSRQGLTSTSRQMTIFYGGQAHVFDDVHPNKADVIMTLAGSNGGSWSTTYSPKPSLKAGKECRIISGGDESGVPNKDSFQLEFHCQRSLPGNPVQVVGSNDRFSAPTGHLGGIVMVKETRNPVRAGEPSIGEKREM